MNCIVCNHSLGPPGHGYFWANDKTGKGLCLDCGKCATCGNRFFPRGYLYTNKKGPHLRYSVTPGLCQDCYDKEWKSEHK